MMTDEQVKQAEWTSENATNDKKVRRHQLAFFIKALIADRRELVAECDRLRKEIEQLKVNQQTRTAAGNTVSIYD